MGLIWGTPERSCEVADISNSPGSNQPAEAWTSSQKHCSFVCEPMGDKPVTELPGITYNIGRELESQGYTKAYMLLGELLLRHKDRDLFLDWLALTCRVNKTQAIECYQCLMEWIKEFL